MTSSPDFERRMNRFENETVAIYELIEDFRGETRDRLDHLETRFDGLETRFDGLETRFDGLETRFDGLETETRTRFDQIDNRFGGIEATLTEVLRRLPEPS